MVKQRFRYTDLQEIKQDINALGLSLPLSERIDILKEPLAIKQYTTRNRLSIQPMEGCDGNVDGSPGELTKRRYERFASSGAGLIWFEAVAINPNSRASPRQLMITEKNLDEYKRLLHDIKKNCREINGFEPIVIIQLTHSGRYSKPNGIPEPIIAYNNPIFEKDSPIPEARIITDDGLKGLEERFVIAAKLAQSAGFDGIDIKACHRYLINELFSAYERSGQYGGSFENRTRFFRNAIAATKASVSDQMLITSRMNLYDGFPYPCGWGVNKTTGIQPDMSEPIRLVDVLHREMGIEMLNFTVGNPYVNPHVNRPYDKGGYESPEHPLVGVSRFCELTALIKAQFPNLIVLSSGYSYLRHFSVNMAAAMIEGGKADIAGFGREAFAYPEFARETLLNGGMIAKKCCITCGKCSELLRAGASSGCVIYHLFY